MRGLLRASATLMRRALQLRRFTDASIADLMLALLVKLDMAEVPEPAEDAAHDSSGLSDETACDETTGELTHDDLYSDD
jgi:hypothetical protein